MARGTSIGGKRYSQVVIKVLERDAKGRPSKVDILYDESVTKIKGGEHFWIIWAPIDMARGKPELH